MEFQAFLKDMDIFLTGPVPLKAKKQTFAARDNSTKKVSYS